MDLKEVIQKHGKAPENLINILLDYQAEKEDNSITEEEIRVVAKELQIPESRIYSVVTFYTLFSIKRRGKYIIQICKDVPCYVNGYVNVVKEFEEALGIKMGETTADGVFTLEYTSCIGCCDVSPAVRVGNTVYGSLDRDKVLKIISDYRRKYNEER